LGAALERATNHTWEALMRDELFAKLDMTTCGFGPPRDGLWGHDSDGAPVSPDSKPLFVGGKPSGDRTVADNPPGLGPAGTVHCALADYGKFLSMHAIGAPALISPETLRHLHTAPLLGYAGGWEVGTQTATTAVGADPWVTTSRNLGMRLQHSGSNRLWFAIAVVVPSEKLAWTIVTNRGEPALEDAVETLLSRYFAK
jgi:D-alanyl-D-alanine carboxypeptidase